MFWIAGADPRSIRQLHRSTCERTIAFGLAIHLPVALWAISAYLLARQVFDIDQVQAFAVAVGCAGLVYLVERLVIAAPRSFWVNAARMMLGIIMAVLGASIVDLVIFEKEIVQELKDSRAADIEKTLNPQLEHLREEVERKEVLWREAVRNAACEANGSCGSGRRGRGPIVDLLEENAERFRQDLVAAQQNLRAIEANKRAGLASAGDVARKESGILGRFEAFHSYAMQNPLVQIAWGLFFLLVLAMELMVVFVKFVFPPTVDDALEEVREYVAARQAADYRDAMTSPVRAAADLVKTTYA
ncbi:DUF4407 domain-containing protein [Ramlibacter tataouinensis]|uniref:DUF4407 domain-containing protein n=1 Tax=Ramlibacter tataouinensis TaxID=94132 RepID=UPI0022F3D08F|nr:DUF4407 domain-containing protein [Ramlibacter tataouinensis]WBY01528.1 DUF4407 domain-containing protein [Ramlibacter tataouinensis]